MLRIDVNVPDSDPRGYRVPDDNPFVDRQPIAALTGDLGVRPAQPVALQLRRLDAGGTGALVIADVGQSAREEVNWEPIGAGGRNYGWRLREGRDAYDTRTAAAYQPLTEPIHDYPRTDGMSITGGYRVSRRGARSDVQRPLLLCGLCRRPRVTRSALALDERQEAARGRSARS